MAYLRILLTSLADFKSLKVPKNCGNRRYGKNLGKYFFTVQGKKMSKFVRSNLNAVESSNAYINGIKKN